MNDKTQAPDTSAVEKTRIRPDMSRYVPAKSGSGKRTHRTDDFVARSLDGKDLETIKTNAGKLGIDYTKWAGLNNGQQRMLIGNALRTRMAAKENALTESDVSKVFGQPAAPYDADAAAAAKAAREAEAAAKKAAKAEAAGAKDASPAAEKSAPAPVKAPKVKK